MEPWQAIPEWSLLAPYAQPPHDTDHFCISVSAEVTIEQWTAELALHSMKTSMPTRRGLVAPTDVTGNIVVYEVAPCTFIALAAAATTGDTSRCHSIQNADHRHLCLALGKKDSSRCHSIQNPDSRHACLAQTQGQRSRCHSIQDRDHREMCLALVPRH